MKRELSIIHHLACSGGTIISKCIAAMHDVVFLSELHPDMVMGAKSNPLKQAQSAYGLISEDELHGIFARHVDFIWRKCESRRLRLVLRDHTNRDFLGTDYLHFKIADVLEPHFDLRRIATIRHPIDIWLGLHERQWLLISFDEFLARYLQFARRSAEIGFVRYEDFTRDPDTALRQICEALNIRFNPAYPDRLPEIQHMTGGSGRQSNDIRPRPRRPITPDAIERFAGNDDYRRALELLGYGHPDALFEPEAVMMVEAKSA